MAHFADHDLAPLRQRTRPLLAQHFYHRNLFGLKTDSTLTFANSSVLVRI
jgi:hypothetical protein